MPGIGTASRWRACTSRGTAGQDLQVMSEGLQAALILRGGLGHVLAFLAALRVSLEVEDAGAVLGQFLCERAEVRSLVLRG